MTNFMVMNGWRDAPHCWWRFLLVPFNWDCAKHPDGRVSWYCFSAFGFTVFYLP